MLMYHTYLKFILNEGERMNLIEQFNNFLSEMKIDYAICGGHAIDLFLGIKTRQHKDLDAVVYWEDRDIIVQYMLNAGWDVYEPIGTPYLHKINDVTNQIKSRTNIWCATPSNPHYKFTEYEKDMYAVDFDNSEQTELDYIEFLFNTRENGAFLYARNKAINLSMDKAILVVDGLPVLAPEMVLLYKSKHIDVLGNQLDFENTHEELSGEQSVWLLDALTVAYPGGHEWLENL